MRSDAGQRHRINRVVNYVRYDRSASVDLDDLADVACLSRHHFSRLFLRLYRETPVAFASRIRLEQAVSDLVFHPGEDITSIALANGFASSQSFSNSFRRRFAVAPRRFRANNVGYITDFPQNQFVVSPVLSGLPDPHGAYIPDHAVALREAPATSLAYVRMRGAYYLPSTSFELAAARLRRWAEIRGLWPDDGRMIGVCPDNPAVTPPHLCQYDFGVEVDSGVEEDETVSIQKLPRRLLATLPVTGSLTEIREAWRWFIAVWLAQSGMAFTGHAFYEEVEFGDDGPDDLRTLLCIPVTSKD